MRRLLSIILLSVISCSAFAQNAIRFLGIPVEGTKKEMISKLTAKGYEYKASEDVLYGEFNGKDVMISVQTVNNRVWRIGIMDESSTDETNIKVRYNNLFEQFLNNKKYKLASGNKLAESEDISYEMLVHKKRYEASFSLVDESINGGVWYMIAEHYGKYGILMFYENYNNAANGDDL